MLHVVTWLWGTKYGADYVNKLREGLARNLDQKYRFLVARPWFDDEYLTKVPGCFCRLRMFDAEWQELNQIAIDDRVVCVDLDVVVTGKLDPVFDRPEPFLILQGANAVNPNPFNGSLMMLRAGAHPEIWSDFSLDAASKIPAHDFPDDQGWLWYKLPNTAGWNCGRESGVWSFAKGKGAAAWPKDNKLPDGARLVAFPGKRDPSQFTHLDWVKTNWCL